jgi:hypothetical protein
MASLTCREVRSILVRNHLREAGPVAWAKVEANTTADLKKREKTI